MKKTILLLLIIFCATVAFAQKSIVKFYPIDASEPKEFDIHTITSFTFITSDTPYLMKIFLEGNDVIDYKLDEINSIDFIDSTKLIFHFQGSNTTINIVDIDSIIFVPKTSTELTIGTQTWMRQNLDVAQYRNGDEIPQVADPTEWENLTTGAWCYYDNDPANSAIYGKLYNWYAVNDSRGIAPEGWHVPSDEEWITLSTFLGGESVAGGKLKEIGRTHWQKPNAGATDEYSFSALPGGYRSGFGTFYDIWFSANWWNSDDDLSAFAFGRYVCYDTAVLYNFKGKKGYGFSIRCVKD